MKQRISKTIRVANFVKPVLEQCTQPKEEEPQTTITINVCAHSLLKTHSHGQLAKHLSRGCLRHPNEHQPHPQKKKEPQTFHYIQSLLPTADFCSLGSTYHDQTQPTLGPYLTICNLESALRRTGPTRVM